MSIFNTPIADLTPDNGEDKDWDVSTGMHQAICAGVCYKADVEIVYEGKSKIQNQVQLYFAVQDGDEVKTIISRPYNFSFHKKSALSKDIKTWGLTIAVLDDFLGKSVSLVVAKDGAYTNINSLLPAQGEADIDMDDVFIPKFWIEDGDGVSTGFEMLMLDGVVARPPKEG